MRCVFVAVVQACGLPIYAVRALKVREQLMSAFGAGRAEGKAIGKSGRPGPLTMFARVFLKNPVMVGSVIPSSRFLIEKILAPLNWGRADVFVEFGQIGRAHV